MEAAGDDDGKTSAALQAKSAKGFPRGILAGGMFWVGEVLGTCI